MTVPILSTEQHWVCPNCEETALTYNSEPRFHNCKGLKGLTAPMVLEGVKCKVHAIVRDDYIGKDLVTLDDDGRPIMTVETVREDGTDCAAFAGCATTRSEG